MTSNDSTMSADCRPTGKFSGPMKHGMIKLKNLIIPVKKEEVKVVFWVSSIIFLILFNVAALRTLRESLVVPAIGPEVVNFIKIWCLLPASFIFSGVYAKMLYYMSYKKTFYYISSAFIFLFVLFAFFLYPNQEYLHLSSDTIASLSASFPRWHWFIVLIGNWSFSLLFIIVELWLYVMFSLLFWQFVNQITQTEQASRLYMSYIFFGHFGPILSGTLVGYIASRQSFVYDLMPHLQDKYVLNYSVFTMVIVNTVLIIAIFYYIHTFVVPKKESNFIPVKDRANDGTNEKPTLLSSIKLLFSSKYLASIAVVIICYSTVEHLCESVWRAQISNAFYTENEYAIFMANVYKTLGIATVILTIFGGNIIRHISWRFAMNITPAVFGIFGIAMFVMIFCMKLNLMELMHYDPIMIIVWVGFIQHIVGKGCKYSIQDACKEMAYIPLSYDLKTKGKAAVDVVCMIIGKSSAALINVALFMIFPGKTYSDLMPYFAVIFVVFMCVWVFYNLRLCNSYEKIIKEQ